MNVQMVTEVVNTVNAVWRTARIDGADPSVRQAWWNAVHDLPAPTLRSGIEQLSRLEDKFPPSPGQFRAICQGQARSAAARAEWLRDHHAEERAQDTRAHRTPKQAAWAATLSAFTHRCVTGFAGVTLPGYETTFDAKLVAYAAQLPTSMHVDDHRAAYLALKSLFEEEWAQQYGYAEAEL